MNHPRGQELFQKFIQDRCTQQELLEFFQYLQDSEYPSEYSNLLHQVWQKIKVKKSLSDEKSEAILQRVLITQTQFSDNRWYRSGWSAAAVIGLLLVSAIAMYLFLSDSSVLYQTAFGELRVIDLPDNSKVTLNGNSKLRYSTDWNHNQMREVWLEGEAFFEVEEVVASNNEHTKFIVHTPQLSIEVIGTQFNVHNRRSETQVVLNSGKVNLLLRGTATDQSIQMVPGELVEYSEAVQGIRQRVVQPDIYSSWKDHQLTFVDTSIREIAEILEDTYGYEVEIQDLTIAEKKFNGEVSTDKLEILFKAIESTFGVEVIQEGNKVFLR